MLSIVVIFRPATALTGNTQDRVAWPSMCTVHTPHWVIPQPYLVPVSPITSRSTQSRGMSSGTSSSCSTPLIMNFCIATSAGDNGWRACQSAVLSMCARLVLLDSSCIDQGLFLCAHARETRCGNHLKANDVGNVGNVKVTFAPLLPSSLFAS